jgi:hypothetical protein
MHPTRSFRNKKATRQTHHIALTLVLIFHISQCFADYVGQQAITPIWAALNTQHTHTLLLVSDFHAINIFGQKQRIYLSALSYFIMTQTKRKAPRNVLFSYKFLSNFIQNKVIHT